MGPERSSGLTEIAILAKNKLSSLFETLLATGSQSLLIIQFAMFPDPYS